jgi:hypothetical protein
MHYVAMPISDWSYRRTRKAQRRVASSEYETLHHRLKQWCFKTALKLSSRLTSTLTPNILKIKTKLSMRLTYIPSHVDLIEIQIISSIRVLKHHNDSLCTFL